MEEALEDLPAPPYPEVNIWPPLRKFLKCFHKKILLLQTGKLGHRLVVVRRKEGVRSGRMFTGPQQTRHFTKQVEELIFS